MFARLILLYELSYVFYIMTINRYNRVPNVIEFHLPRNHFVLCMMKREGNAPIVM